MKNIKVFESLCFEVIVTGFKQVEEQVTIQEKIKTYFDTIHVYLEYVIPKYSITNIGKSVKTVVVIHYKLPLVIVC